ERAFELVELASDELSSTIGGAEGLFRLCNQNAGKFSALSEVFSEGKLEVKLKEGALVLLFESSGGSVKIKFVGYDKGN
ncbi:MAG: hypothetical protein NZL90_02365, partial [Aquificaceae bacterium]|nr:hypothetical protein [Aquificaceae bacterium]